MKLNSLYGSERAISGGILEMEAYWRFQLVNQVTSEEDVVGPALQAGRNMRTMEDFACQHRQDRL